MKRTMKSGVIPVTLVVAFSSLTALCNRSQAADQIPQPTAPVVVPVGVAPGYYGPDTREFPQTLVERVPDAAADAARGRMNLLRSQSDLNGLFRKMRFLNDRAPSYRSVAGQEQASFQAYQNARNVALARLAQDEDYKAVVSLRDELSDRLETLRKVKDIRPSDLVPLAEEKMNYARAASAMEAKALAEDTDVTATRDQFVAAGKELATTKLAFEDSLRYHPDVESARGRLADARTTNVVTATYLQALLDSAEANLQFAYDMNRTGGRSRSPYRSVYNDYYGYDRNFEYRGWGYGR